MSEKKTENNYKVVRGSILELQEEIYFNDKTPQVCRDFQFFNHSGIDLWICFPEGIYIHLKAGNNGQPIKRKENKSIVYDSLVIKHHYNTQSSTRVQWIDGNEDEHLQELRKRFESNTNFSWYEEITIDKITRHCRGVYISSCDVVVTLSETNAQRYHHFRCVQRIRNDYAIAVNDVNTNNSLHAYIRLIDNEGLLGDQWTIFHNRVIRLKAKKNPHVASGLYIAGLLEEGVMEEALVAEDLFYTLDQVKKGDSPIQIFQTREEALVEKNKPFEKLLDIKSKEQEQEYKKVMSEKEKEHEMKILAQKEKNAELERKLLEYDKEIKLSKLLREEQYERKKNDMDEDAMYRKHRYETKHDDNKAMVETIKTVSIVVSAGLALAAFMR